MTEIDDLLATVRTNACLNGPLKVLVELRAAGSPTTGTTLPAMVSAASAQTQMLQGQGIITGRHATISLDAAAVQTALSRQLDRGDEVRIASGEYLGLWLVQTDNPVRGGWARAEIKLELGVNVTSAQEQR